MYKFPTSLPLCILQVSSVSPVEKLYSRTRLRRTRLGNNKKYVLSEVHLIRVHR